MKEAAQCGDLIAESGLTFDVAYTSVLKVRRSVDVFGRTDGLSHGVRGKLFGVILEYFIVWYHSFHCQLKLVRGFTL